MSSRSKTLEIIPIDSIDLPKLKRLDISHTIIGQNQEKVSLLKKKLPDCKIRTNFNMGKWWDEL